MVGEWTIYGRPNHSRISYSKVSGLSSREELADGGESPSRNSLRFNWSSSSEFKLVSEGSSEDEIKFKIEDR